MEYDLKIGGIGFHIVSHFEIRVEESYAPFLLPNLVSSVNIEFSQDFQQAPHISSPLIGEDLLLAYYEQDGTFITAAKGGPRGMIAVTTCDTACKNLVCYINAEVFGPQDSLSDLLRMIPMRRILQHHGALFFHASQIALGGTGILFSAPSGTGKTTQAKLWRDFRGAELICNDRTLVRDGLTYGFPLDGSEPVHSGRVNKLGAIVLLRQSSENRIRRLKAGAALAGLFPQLVIDTWDPASRDLAMDQLMSLIQNFPVYLLECTPDENAVACLEQRMTADGVIL